MNALVMMNANNYVHYITTEHDEHIMHDKCTSCMHDECTYCLHTITDEQQQHIIDELTPIFVPLNCKGNQVIALYNAHCSHMPYFYEC